VSTPTAEIASAFRLIGCILGVDLSACLLRNTQRVPTIPLAHIGHWWGYILYAVPAIIVFVATVQSLIAQRRERRAEEAAKR
jgi:hypothetical protein